MKEEEEEERWMGSLMIVTSTIYNVCRWKQVPLGDTAVSTERRGYICSSGIMIRMGCLRVLLLKKFH